MSIYFIFLRQPKDREDRRNDPFWEFGSFGRTGCHHANLLRPDRCPIQAGDRLAFIQGGRRGLCLVGLTPPLHEVRVVACEGRDCDARCCQGGQRVLECRWDNSYRPLKYSEAPLFMDNHGHSQFAGASALAAGVARSTPVARISSRLRASKTPASPALAAEVESAFDTRHGAGNEATIYLDAVMHSDEEWHGHGRSAGWAELSERQAEFIRVCR